MRPTLLAVIVLSLTALVGAEHAAAKTTICKNTYGGDFIRAKELKCKKARAVVRAWGAGYKIDGQPNREALGFACSGTDDAVEGLVVKCTRPGQRITFYANVP